MTSIYDTLRTRCIDLYKTTPLWEAPIVVKARTLSTEEAIGDPEADDFPLQKGNERLMQAQLGKGIGQAFTDQYGDFEGTLHSVLEMPLENNYRRAVFVATINAVLHDQGQITGTIHCRDKEPAECAKKLADHIRSRYGTVRIAQVGFQPRMVEALATTFSMRLLDLDPSNIGTTKFNVLVEGPEATDAVIDWADMLLVTGSTVANGTVESFIREKPVLFYGTTVAGAAHLMEWDRFCACSH